MGETVTKQQIYKYSSAQSHHTFLYQEPYYCRAYVNVPVALADLLSALER